MCVYLRTNIPRLKKEKYLFVTLFRSFEHNTYYIYVYPKQIHFLRMQKLQIQIYVPYVNSLKNNISNFYYLLFTAKK